MSGGLHITLGVAGADLRPVVTQAPALPVARLMCGRAPEDVARLARSLFNLCGEAQDLAVRLALDLPRAEADLGREILRDHLFKLMIAWPGLLGLAPRALPLGWEAGGPRLVSAVWGGAAPAHLAEWLAAGRGVAPALAALAEAFVPGEAVADLAPLTDPFGTAPQENSPAGRRAGHPLMAEAEAAFGRGPLWRALGRLLDLAAFAETPPRGETPAPGRALVPAARGTYALAARAEGGVVTEFLRRTPTDHLLAPGGALEAALGALPAAKASRAGLVVDILDPCVAVVMEGCHA